MMRRMTTTMDSVNTTPAHTMMARLRYGIAMDHSSTRPESAVTVNMNISGVKKRGSADFESLVSSRMVPPASLNRAQAARLGPSAQYTEFVEHKYDGGHNQEAAEDEARACSGTTRTRRAPRPRWMPTHDDGAMPAA